MGEEPKLAQERNASVSASGAFEMASKFSSELVSASKSVGQSSNRNLNLKMMNRGVALQDQFTMGGVKFRVHPY